MDMERIKEVVADAWIKSADTRAGKIRVLSGCFRENWPVSRSTVLETLGLIDPATPKGEDGE